MLEQFKVVLRQHDVDNQIKTKIYEICLHAYQKINKKKGYSASKSFFVSAANQFIEQLVHIHSEIINKLIKHCVKQHNSSLVDEQTSKEISCFYSFTKISIQQWLLQQKQQSITMLAHIIIFFLANQCHNKSKNQRQNIYLEIQCSLNYTCPVCLSKRDIKSTTLIKDDVKGYQKQLFEEQIHAKTSKKIDIERKSDEKYGGSIKAQMKLQNILEQMNQKRKNLKILDDDIRNTATKQWTLFGKILDLNRQQFITNMIQNQKSNDKKQLFDQLKQNNIGNEHFINKFRRKILLKGIKPILDQQNQYIFQSFNQSLHNKNRKSMEKKRFVNIPIRRKLSLLKSIEQRESNREIKQQKQRKQSEIERYNQSLNKISVNSIDFSLNGFRKNDNNRGNKLPQNLNLSRARRLSSENFFIIKESKTKAEIFGKSLKQFD